VCSGTARSSEKTAFPRRAGNQQSTVDTRLQAQDPYADEGIEDLYPKMRLLRSDAHRQKNL